MVQVRETKYERRRWPVNESSDGQHACPTDGLKVCLGSMYLIEVLIVDGICRHRCG